MTPRCGKKPAQAAPASKKPSSQSKKKKPPASKPAASRPKQADSSEKIKSGVKPKDLNDLVKMVGAMQVARYRENGEFPPVTFKHCGAQIPASLHFYLNDNKYISGLITDAAKSFNKRGTTNPASKESKMLIACANQCEKLSEEIEEDYGYLYEEQESLMSVVRSYLTGSMVRKCDRVKNQMAGNPFAAIRSFDFDSGERRGRAEFLARLFEKGPVGIGDYLETRLKAAAELEKQQREEAESSINNDGAGLNDDLYMADEDVDNDGAAEDDENDSPPDKTREGDAAPPESQGDGAADGALTDQNPTMDKRGEKRRLTMSEKRANAHKLMRMQDDVQIRHVECIESEGPQNLDSFLDQNYTAIYSRFSATVIRQALTNLHASNEFNTTVPHFDAVAEILDRAQAEVITQHQQQRHANANVMPVQVVPRKPTAPPIKMTAAQRAAFLQRLREDAEFSDDDDDVTEGLTDEQRKQKLLEEQQKALREAEEEEEDEMHSDSRNSGDSVQPPRATTPAALDEPMPAAAATSPPVSSPVPVSAKHGAESLMEDLDLSDEEELGD